MQFIKREVFFYFSIFISVRNVHNNILYFYIFSSATKKVLNFNKYLFEYNSKKMFPIVNVDDWGQHTLLLNLIMTPIHMSH